MRGRRLIPFLVAALVVATAPALAPLRRAPVLPEVEKHLELGRADVETNSFARARAHAQLVLLGSVIKVEAKFQDVPASREGDCLKSLDYAMHEWEHVLDGSIHFQRVPANENASVVVRFRPQVTMHGEQVAGYVNWKRTLTPSKDGTVNADFTADLQIRVKNLDGHAMPPNAMRHAAMHELGHVLGLDDSPREGDLMGPLDIERPVSGPQPYEVETVRNLRAEASNIMQAASGPGTR